MDPGEPPEASGAIPPNKNAVMDDLVGIARLTDDTARRQQANEFIQKRVAALTATCQPVSLDVARSSTYAGFIHPETKLYKNLLLYFPLRIDDPAIYDVFFEAFSQYRQDPAYATRSDNQVMLFAIHRTLNGYFGIPPEGHDSEAANLDYYESRSIIDDQTSAEEISIAEFRGKGNAVCLEKAAVAQNLLALVGMTPELIVTPNFYMRLNEGGETGQVQGHAYVIFQTPAGHRYLFDPAIPRLVRNADGVVIGALPAYFPISEAQYANLTAGEQLEIADTDIIKRDGGYYQQPVATRVYQGPTVIPGLTQIPLRS